MKKKEKPKMYTREWFVEQGKIGGKKTKELYGLKHYSRIRGKNSGRKKLPVENSLDNPPVKVYNE